MIPALWTILTTNKLARALGIAVMAVLGVLTFGAIKKREGANGERANQAESRAEAAQRGTEGAAKAVTELRKGKTPQEVKDANDARW